MIFSNSSFKSQQTKSTFMFLYKIKKKKLQKLKAEKAYRLKTKWEKMAAENETIKSSEEISREQMEGER